MALKQLCIDWRKESVFELEMIFLLIFSLSSQKFEPDIAKRWMKMEDTQYVTD